VSARRGPDLPYSVVCAVTPSRTKWLAASAKIAGSTFAPEPLKVYDSFIEVLDERPSFSSIVVNAPIGYRDSPEMGPRNCDLDARALLHHRGKFVHNAPTYLTINKGSAAPEDHLDAITTMLLPSYLEVSREMFAYRQRVVYEGNPELSFYQLNGDVPLRESKKLEDGRDERRVILEKKVPNIDKIIDAEVDGVPSQHLLDVAALLWTARRVFSRGAKRIPEDAEWDSQGLRMEFVF
jgi:predicted RNase H-like nuclease